MSLLTNRIHRATQEILQTKTDRDKQINIGPSDMADPCNKCLASKLAGVKPEREWSMFPWLGTAIHKLIEWTTHASRFRWVQGENDLAWELFGDGRAVFESRYFICSIPGYGDVYGSIDVMLLVEKAIVDWKSSSVKKIKLYKAVGVPDEYIGQVMMYLNAVRQHGYDFEKAVLVFIPRDAPGTDSIWEFEVTFDQEKVDAILNRIQQLMQWVEAGRWQELKPHPDCWTCNPPTFWVR